MINPLPYWIAVTSLLLYFSLAVVSFYYFFLIMKRLRGNSMSDYLPGEVKFVRSKQIFFLSLGISSLLDTPLYIGCIYNQGPMDCEWDGYSYSACWIIHRLALAGYFISLGIPLIQWTDVIYTQDDNIFSKRNSRRFLFISTACYCSLQIITSIAVFSASDAENHNSFASSAFDDWSGIFEAVFLVCILAIWLWCGVRLQLYVMRVCFRPDAERKIIFMVNIVMFAILLSYTLRALMVMSLSFSFCGFYICNYLVWIIGTRWLPYVFCSYLLIYTMRRSTESNSDSKAVVDMSDCISTSLLIDEHSQSQHSFIRTTISSISRSKRGSEASSFAGGPGARDRHSASSRSARKRSISNGSKRSKAAGSTSGDKTPVTEHQTEGEAALVEESCTEGDEEDGDMDEWSGSQSEFSGSASSHSVGNMMDYHNEQYHIVPHHDDGPGYASDHSVTSIISFLHARNLSADAANPNPVRADGIAEVEAGSGGSNNVNFSNSGSLRAYFAGRGSSERDRDSSRSSASSFKQFFLGVFTSTPSPQPNRSQNVSRVSASAPVLNVIEEDGVNDVRNPLT